MYYVLFIKLLFSRISHFGQFRDLKFSNLKFLTLKIKLLQSATTLAFFIAQVLPVGPHNKSECQDERVESKFHCKQLADAALMPP